MRKICVVGLGYVGLPLAVKFGKKHKTNGFDINKKRVEELKKHIDSTEEISSEEIKKARLKLSDNPKIIAESDFIIITVPTPIDVSKKPDLTLVEKASKMVGKNLKKGAIVVYESTFYPGVTEEICVPILEKESGLKCGKDFKVGYSPERINPGDKKHTVEKITKIVSGMDKESLDIISKTYSSILKAGVFKVSSIKVAEAAKVIENIQRDINIALMNELKMIFDKKGIAIKEVLEAASTKWNFVKYMPGLVGGHCIGVDPYYLAYDAEKIGHHPEIILAGRRINDNMAKYEAIKIIRELNNNGHRIKDTKIVILGATFKPNVKDLRNSKVECLAKELVNFGCTIKICEPNVKSDKIFGYNNITVKEALKQNHTTAIYAVKHYQFRKKEKELKRNFKEFIELF